MHSLDSHVSTKSKQQFTALFGLRAMAAFWVIVFHLHFFFGILNSKMTLAAPIAPDLFFILSGFVLCYQYQSTFVDQCHWRDYSQYLLKRFARLWPSLFFVYLLGVVVYLIIGYLTHQVLSTHFLHDFIISTLLVMTMIYVWVSQDRIQMRQYLWDKTNVTLWSVSAEWFSYLWLPVLIKPLLKWRLFHILLIMLCLWLSLTIVAYHQPQGLMHCLYGYTALLRSLSGFVMGIVGYRLMMLGKCNDYHKLMLSILALVSITLFIYFQILLLETLVLPFVVLLIVGLTGNNIFSSLFSSRVMRLLGEWSYGIYLIHWLILNMCRYGFSFAFPNQHVLKQWVSNHEFLFVVLFMGIVITSGALLHHYIEMPCRRYIMSCFRRSHYESTFIKSV